MRDYLDLGSCPVDEDGCSMQDDDYYVKAHEECKVFIGQLKRQFGDPPNGCWFKIASNPHDFGIYYSVRCVFDDTYTVKKENDFGELEDVCEGMEYAYNIESELPLTWDDEARTELGL